MVGLARTRLGVLPPASVAAESAATKAVGIRVIVLVVATTGIASRAPTRII